MCVCVYTFIGGSIRSLVFWKMLYAERNWQNMRPERYTHTHTHVLSHTHTRVFTHTHLHTCTYMHIHTYPHVLSHAHTYTCFHTHTHMCFHTLMHTYMCFHTHVLSHTHTHILCLYCCVLSHSVMSDSYDRRTESCQAPLPVGFFRQESWNGSLTPSLRDLPISGIKPVSVFCVS